MTEEFNKALTAWLERAQAIVTADWKKKGYTYREPNILSINPNGIKYLRIVSKEPGHTGGYVYCFIEIATGNVLKGAGYKTPAKGVRGNIYEVGKEGVGPYGALYLR